MQQRRFRPRSRSNKQRPSSDKINPNQYIKKAQQAEVETYTPQQVFADFPIDTRLKNNIAKKGYTTPTPIQDQAIPHIVDGRDVIGVANTGTGKTAAFLIPLIDKIIKDRTQKALIIVPTRELAQQIKDECVAFTQHLGIRAVVCIGGVSVYTQIGNLKRGHNLVIATPGRLKDLENQKKLFLHEYKTIVLDEVDRMLDMGFIHDIKHIIARLPRQRQSLFFSATMPRQTEEIAQLFLTDPVTISVKSQQTSHLVDQDIVTVGGRAKVDVLAEILSGEGCEKVIVFGHTKWGTEKLARILDKKGFRAAAIHGNKTQNQRQRALRDFREGKVQVLLATDVASRGLDIDDVTHVINYDEPATYDDYIHRIGRTGRANKKGFALTFVD